MTIGSQDNGRAKIHHLPKSHENIRRDFEAHLASHLPGAKVILKGSYGAGLIDLLVVDESFAGQPNPFARSDALRALYDEYWVTVPNGREGPIVSVIGMTRDEARQRGYFVA